jgi:hypothetical protein
MFLNALNVFHYPRPYIDHYQPENAKAMLNGA